MRYMAIYLHESIYFIKLCTRNHGQKIVKIDPWKNYTTSIQKQFHPKVYSNSLDMLQFLFQLDDNISLIHSITCLEMHSLDLQKARDK